MSRLLIAFILPLTTIVAPLSAQTQLHVGDRLPEIVLEDQHGQEQRIGHERMIIFVRSMDASKIVHEVLTERNGDEWLAANNARFVADIHRMPGIISRFIAKPRMRDYNYTILLIEDEGVGDVFPAGENDILVLRAGEDAHITHIDTATTAAGLVELLRTDP